jgi:acyl carrier protein
MIPPVNAPTVNTFQFVQTFWRFALCFVLIDGLLVVSGCSSEAKPDKGSTSQATPDADEQVVRAVISEKFKVDPVAIAMDKPISEPPLKADDLDIVEIVMELEERLLVQVSDKAIERYNSAKLGNGGKVGITPNQLVTIVKESPKIPQSKTRK